MTRIKLCGLTRPEDIAAAKRSEAAKKAAATRAANKAASEAAAEEGLKEFEE